MATKENVDDGLIAELANQEVPILENETLNPLTLLTVFLIKTADWDGKKAEVKFILKGTTPAFTANLLQSARMRLSRIRSRLRNKKHEYRPFKMVMESSTLIYQEPNVPMMGDYEVTLLRLGVGYSTQSTSFLENYL